MAIIYIVIGVLFFIFIIGPALVGLLDWLDELFKK